MPDSNSRLNVGFGTPFQEQIDFLRQKLNLPTERWDDIQRGAHDRAFIVAGAAKADLLAELHDAVNRAAQDGKGIAAFRKDFKTSVAKNGWTGWTGEGTKAGEAWRTRVIYQTNMSTSYWAGRYQQMTDPEVLKLHPYWRYIHSDGVLHPREDHLAWHGLTLLADNPFWKTHFAPNGIGCQCRITSVTRREGEVSARAGLDEPPAGWDKIDPKTGEQVGIGKGFGYTPGASVKKSMQEFIDAKLIKLSAPIGAEMWEVLKPVLAMERLAAWQTVFDATRQSMQAGGIAVMVHTVAPATVAALAENKVVLETAAVWMRDTELLHTLRDIGIPLSIDDFGTGYSSLAYLQKLPVSGLKIDRAFVDKVDRLPGTQKLVKAMIEMGHGMDLMVTAEGVETQAEKDTITRLGCDIMQGYYASRPLHGTALAAWYDSL